MAPTGMLNLPLTLSFPKAYILASHFKITSNDNPLFLNSFGHRRKDAPFLIEGKYSLLGPDSLYFPVCVIFFFKKVTHIHRNVIIL